MSSNRGARDSPGQQRRGSSSVAAGATPPEAPASPASPSGGMTPEQWSKISLGECIGKGAFGKVFRGFSMQTGEVVAIKSVEKELLSEEQLPSILRELELLQTLEHRNIVKFKGFHDTDHSLFMVLEFMESGSLYSTMKKFGSFPEQLIAVYVRQVLEGLKYLHNRGIIHRDLKGANLLLTKTGVLKLADFGSCTYSALNKNNTVVGTPFWMAPEIIEMNGGCIASDIWSLGCTVMELNSGTPPYWDAGAMGAMFRMVEDEHPEIPTTCSTEMQAFLERCFVRDVTKRATCEELLKHPFITENVSAVQISSIDDIQATIRDHKPSQRKQSVATMDWGSGSQRSSGDGGSGGDPRSQKRVLTRKAVKERLIKLTRERDALGKERDELLQQLQQQTKDRKNASAKNKKLKEKLTEVTAERDRYREERDQADEKAKALTGERDALVAELRRWRDVAAKASGNTSSPGTVRRLSNATSPRGYSTISSHTKSPRSKLVGAEKFGHQRSASSTGDTAKDGMEPSPPPTVHQSASPRNAETRKPESSTRPVCAGCGEAIKGTYKEAVGKPWHETCLRCSHCNKRHKSYVNRDGKPYCVEDFQKLFGRRCGGCNEVFKPNQRYIKALEADWHPECFSCNECKGSLTSGFFEVRGKPLCKACFTKR